MAKVSLFCKLLYFKHKYGQNRPKSHTKPYNILNGLVLRNTNLYLPTARNVSLGCLCRDEMLQQSADQKTKSWKIGIDLLYKRCRRTSSYRMEKTAVRNQAIKLKPVAGRQVMGLGFDIFQNFAVRFPVPSTQNSPPQALLSIICD